MAYRYLCHRKSIEMTYRLVRCLHDCTLLQIDIDSTSQWSIDNEFDLNSRNSLVITSSCKTLPVFLYNSLGSAILKRVSVVRQLCVRLNEKLNFKSHVLMILLSSNRVFCIVSCISSSFHDPTFFPLFISLFWPKGDFASVVRNNLCDTDAVSKDQKILVSKLQKYPIGYTLH